MTAHSNLVERTVEELASTSSCFTAIPLARRCNAALFAASPAGDVGIAPAGAKPSSPVFTPASSATPSYSGSRSTTRPSWEQRHSLRDAREFVRGKEEVRVQRRRAEFFADFVEHFDGGRGQFLRKKSKRNWTLSSHNVDSSYINKSVWRSH